MPPVSRTSPLPKSRRRCQDDIDKHISEFKMDSGSESEFEDDDGEDVEDYLLLQDLRDYMCGGFDAECERTFMEQGIEVNDEPMDGDEECEDQDHEQPPLLQHGGLYDFTWSKDFSSFTGHEEVYLLSPGPTVKTQDPVELFMEVWDNRIMQEIVNETNKYAWQVIAPLSETASSLPEYLEWTELTVAELYRYFAVLILMSVCYRSNVKEYWTTGILEMPIFRKTMSRDRFLIITKFLHFVDNDYVDNRLSSYDKQIFKIRPIVDHCNSKFMSLYTPNQHLSLGESLLLWKGRLSWVQYSPSEEARCGIKSFDLCEAETGYQLRCLLYSGKDSPVSEVPIQRFETSTAKIILQLMDGLLDVGHTVVMDSLYNQLPLMRYLKRRCTDVIGIVNRRRVHIINAMVKEANEINMTRGQQEAWHCGDISLFACKDLKLTAISTCHNDRQIAERPGVDIEKPQLIVDYYKYRRGVDLKNKKLSTYFMERKHGKKWYMKVFKRLMNVSLLNTYIIYSKKVPKPRLDHTGFRLKVASDLLEMFPNPQPSAPVKTVIRDERRLILGDHFPFNTEKVPGINRRRQRRCARCTAAGRRKMTTLICSFCEVPLCAGPCWAEFHEAEKL